MITSLEALLLDDEGLRVWPYTDTTGCSTWGVGHNLTASPVSPVVETLLKTAAMTQFRLDLADVLAVLSVQPWWGTIGEARQAAVSDMLFNLGVHALQAFTTFFDYLARGQYQDAADDLRTTRVYAQLTHRYARLAEMIETGDWPT